MAQKFLTDIEVTQGLVDSSGDLGVAGQVLSSTGSGTNWITNEANSTVVYLDEFTGDNSTVDFTISVSVTDENITQVYIDGVYQNKDTYSVSNTTLTFSTAPPLNADIEVITFSTATTSDDLAAGSVIIPVKNTHTASIAKGEPVYITGNVGSSARLQIAPADASNSAKMPAAGLLLQTLAVNAEGYVITGGYLRNITTDTIDGTSTTSNDTVYVKSGGGLTMTKPTGTNLIQNIAKVARSSGGSSGSLLVSSILRTNDVPNITNDYFWLGNSSGVATPTEFTSTARGLLSVGTEGTAAGDGNLAYNNSSGVFTYTPPVLGGLSGTTDNITEGSTNLYYTDTRSRGSISSGGDLSYNSTTGVMSYTTPTTIASLSNHDTDDLSEGSTNLYYTDTRVGTYLTNNSYATQSYVDTEVSNLVDSAPATLDTLNELAAALGDDANFSTTVTNSIATKLPLAGGTLTGALSGTSATFSGNVTGANLNISNWDTAYGWGDHAGAGYITGYTETDTLATVTGRGATTSTPIVITASGTANAASLQIDNPSSSTFNHSIEAFTANLTNGESNIILVGKEGNTKNSGYLGYYWTASGSNNNFVSLGHWSADHLFRVYGDSVLSTVTLRSDVDMQAPIFYDKDNTSYYLNPNSTSNLSIVQAGSWLFRPMSGQVEYHVLDNGSINGPSWKFRYDGATANRWVDFGYKDGNGTYYEGLKLYNNSTITWKGNAMWHAGNDGSGSGLDADLLDGVQGSGYYRHYETTAISSYDSLTAGAWTTNSTTATNIPYSNYNATWHLSDTASDRQYQIFLADTSAGGLRFRAKQGSSGWHSWEKVWTDVNDGAGSGLDADLLDGQQGSYYAQASKSNNKTYTSTGNAAGSYLGAHYSSGGTEKPNSGTFGAGKLKLAMLSSSNLGFGGSWNDVLWMSSYNGGDVKRSTALVSSKYDNTSLWVVKQNFDSSSWGTGYLLSAYNVNPNAGNLYANIFYDSDNTAFYVNPASESNLGELRLNTGGLQMYRAYNNNAIWWAANDDANHALWNDYSGGPGTRGAGGSGFDGMKWNAYRGLHIRGGTGGAYNCLVITNTSSNLNTHTVELYAYDVKQLQTASGYALANNQMRAPIFYDSLATSYYVDPGSATSINTAGIINAAGIIKGNYFVGTNYATNGYTVYKGYDNWNHFISIRGHCRPGQSKTQSAILGGHQTSFVEYAESNSTTGWFFIGSGQTNYIEVAKITRAFSLFEGSVRAPLFYDSNNTGYYTDPASTSVLNALQFNYTQHGSANNIRMGNSTTMNAISSGTNNAAFGVEALGNCSTGSRNFAYGYAALFSLTSGSNNIAMGDATGYNVTSGNNNLLFGVNAGRTGYQTPQSMAGIATASNQIHMGNESHSTARIQISWTVNSDARDKTDVTPINVGLDFVNQLNPVTFRWDKRSDYEDRTPTGENKLEELTLGFLAQEVETVEKAYGYDVATKTNLVVDRDVENDGYGLTYEKMIPILTKAIQELKADNDSLRARIQTLEDN